MIRIEAGISAVSRCRIIGIPKLSHHRKGLNCCADSAQRRVDLPDAYQRVRRKIAERWRARGSALVGAAFLGAWRHGGGHRGVRLCG